MNWKVLTVKMIGHALCLGLWAGGFYLQYKVSGMAGCVAIFLLIYANNLQHRDRHHVH